MTIIHTEKYVLPLTISGRIARDTIKKEWEKLGKTNIESGVTMDGFIVKCEEEITMKERNKK